MDDTTLEQAVRDTLAFLDTPEAKAQMEDAGQTRDEFLLDELSKLTEELY